MAEMDAGSMFPRDVPGLFRLPGAPAAVRRNTVGHIHATFELTIDRPDGARRFVLQRMNERVFPDIPWVMNNIVRVTRHLEAKPADGRAVAVPVLVPTADGAAWTRDRDGAAWRCWEFVEGTAALVAASSALTAGEAGRAFGLFLRGLGDLPGPRLVEVLPGFHDTPRRLETFRRAVAEDPVRRRNGCEREISALLERVALAPRLTGLRDAGVLPERPVHNDTKISNVLFAEATGRAVCVIDLDTVMPGLAAWDFGELVRTGASTAAEDTTDPASMRVDEERLRAIARGFLAGAGSDLSAAEREHLFDGALLMTFENALRFLADHLQGDRYYRVARPGHNLDRCRAQLALLDALEAGEDRWRRLIREAE